MKKRTYTAPHVREWDLGMESLLCTSGEDLPVDPVDPDVWAISIVPDLLF